MGAQAARVLAFGRRTARAVLSRHDHSLRQWLSSPTSRKRRLLLATAVVWVSGTVGAGSTGVMERARPEYDAKGIALGGFRMFPTLGIGFSTTNNVFEADKGRKGDVYLAFAPQVRVASDWSQHALELYARANVLRYAGKSSEDVSDWVIGANSKIDVRRTTNLQTGVWSGRFHDRRSSPNSPGNIAEPVTYEQLHAQSTLSVQPNRLRLSIGAEYDDFSYNLTPLIGGGRLNNRDRDRDELRLRGRVSLEVSEGYFGFLEIVHDRRDFELAVDRTGVNRDSDGTAVNGGFEFDLPEVLKGEVFAGYLNREFDAPLKDVSGLNYGASLTWAATQLTTVRIGAARVLNDTVVAGSAVISDKSLSLGVDHELLRNVIIQADLNYVDSDFVGIAREDSGIEGSIRATYLMNSNVHASASFTHRDRDSNVPNADFSEDMVSVGLHLQL